MKDSSHKRHIAKAITWRFVGTVDTTLLSWFVTGDAFVGLQIGLTEVLTKILLYYLHERLWFNVNFKGRSSNWRHITKTLSWRTVGTIDTILLAWIISGDPTVGLQIGFIEVVTKMLLYYLHERTWYRINFGLENRAHKKENETGK